MGWFSRHGDLVLLGVYTTKRAAVAARAWEGKRARRTQRRQPSGRSSVTGPYLRSECARSEDGCKTNC
jgi:hypothetical protein